VRYACSEAGCTPRTRLHRAAARCVLRAPALLPPAWPPPRRSRARSCLACSRASFSDSSGYCPSTSSLGRPFSRQRRIHEALPATSVFDRMKAPEAPRTPKTPTIDPTGCARFAATPWDGPWKISLHDSGLAHFRGLLGAPRNLTRCSAPELRVRSQVLVVPSYFVCLASKTPQNTPQDELAGPLRALSRQSMQPLNCILRWPDAVLPRLLMRLAFELLPRRKRVSFGLGPSGRWGPRGGPSARPAITPRFAR
jgi:hypothetical protein